MSNKNANIQAGGSAEVELQGLSINFHIDKVIVRGNGNVDVSAQESGGHHDDRNHRRDRRNHRDANRTDQARQDQHRNAHGSEHQAQDMQRAQNEAILKMLQQLDKRLSDIAQRHF